MVPHDREEGSCLSTPLLHPCPYAHLPNAPPSLDPGMDGCQTLGEAPSMELELVPPGAFTSDYKMNRPRACSTGIFFSSLWFQHALPPPHFPVQCLSTHVVACLTSCMDIPGRPAEPYFTLRNLEVAKGWLQAQFRRRLLCPALARASYPNGSGKVPV